MTFDEVMPALRSGRRIARGAWLSVPSTNVWLVLVPGSTIEVWADRPLGKAAPELVGRTVEYAPHIDMVMQNNTQGTIMMELWPASHADLMAYDWYAVPA